VKAGKQSLTLHDPKDNSTKPNAAAFHGQEMGAIQSSTIFPVSNSFDGGILSQTRYLCSHSFSAIGFSNPCFLSWAIVVKGPP